MAEPLIAQRTPYAVELAPGDYWKKRKIGV
jgi:hypothetical protein